MTKRRRRKGRRKEEEKLRDEEEEEEGEEEQEKLRDEEEEGGGGRRRRRRRRKRRQWWGEGWKGQTPKVLLADANLAAMRLSSAAGLSCSSSARRCSSVAQVLLPRLRPLRTLGTDGGEVVERA